jgi:asparagine synthase (glutamine-hydrolysing)
MMHGADMGALAWPIHATDGHLTAMSLGVPIGLDITAGPLGLGRRLLDGEDLHRDVVPPFGLVVVDGDRRVVVQQDWLGMCRIFTATVDGLTVFATRPSLVADFLHGSPAPDLSAWGSYMATGFFGGSMSPVEGVRLLDPGERLVAERHEDGWRIESQARIGVDAIVLAGRAGANRLDDALDEAAQALIGTATGLSQIYSGPIELGLSGGKDSRLIAAASLAAGLRPNLVTNIDVPEEGETASELVAIVRKTRGIDLNHRLRKVSDPATVLDVGLAERIDRFQHLFDYQYPSSFSVRPPPGPRLEMDVDVRLSGVGGELVSGYWYPKAKQTPVDTATRQLMRAIPQAALRSDVHAAEEARIRGILAAISEAGLDAEHIIDYLYLVERVRRWYSSAYSFMIITPFLAPGFVKASFAFDPREKRERAVHARLLQRLLPEWADIPFVSDTSTTTATRVWQGDGITTIAEMRDTCKGSCPRWWSRTTWTWRCAWRTRGSWRTARCCGNSPGRRRRPSGWSRGRWRSPRASPTAGSPRRSRLCRCDPSRRRCPSLSASRVDLASHWWRWPARSPTPRRGGSGPGRPPARCSPAASSIQQIADAAFGSGVCRRALVRLV